MTRVPRRPRGQLRPRSRHRRDRRRAHPGARSRDTRATAGWRSPGTCRWATWAMPRRRRARFPPSTGSATPSPATGPGTWPTGRSCCSVVTRSRSTRAGRRSSWRRSRRAIAGHPAVADVVVTGRPSERWGQEVVAVVQLAEGAETTADSITDPRLGLHRPLQAAQGRDLREGDPALTVGQGRLPLGGRAGRKGRGGLSAAGDRVGVALHLHGPAAPAALHPGRPGAVRRPQHPSRSSSNGWASRTRAESDALAERINAEIEQEGWGFWAVEVVRGEPFIGMVGLHRVNAVLSLRPRGGDRLAPPSGALGPRVRHRGGDGVAAAMVSPAGWTRSWRSPPPATCARRRSCDTSAWCATRRRTSITLRCRPTAPCGPTCCTGPDPVAPRQRARKVATCRRLLPLLTLSIPMRSSLTTDPAATGPPVHGTSRTTTPNGECRCTTTAPTSSSSSSKGPRPG